MRIEWVIILLWMTLLTGCTGNAPRVEVVLGKPWTPKRPIDIIEIPKPMDPIQRNINTMSLEEKAGQVLMLSYRTDLTGKDQLYMDANLSASLQTLQPGGVVLFSQNILETEQLKKFIQDLKSYAPTEYPLWIAVDEEGGRVSRMTGKNLGFPITPPALEIGSTGGLQMAYETGVQLGENLKIYGIDVNFAPVADVYSNPANKVIGDRAYSSSAEVAGKMAYEVARGMMNQNIIPVYKHFPGHGDTEYDSHFGAVTVAHGTERLNAIEFVPFKMGIEKGIPMIMTAHLMLPAYDAVYPATLSKTILTDVLRDQLGFEGVIITDALEMGAISTHWTSAEAAVLALNAGADLLLMPENAADAKQGIIDAVIKGALPIERLDEAVYRILKLKQSIH